MILLDRFITPPEPCPYLPGEASRLLYEVVADLSPAEYETRINTGWRKFGAFLFRPVCASCRECRPLRVLASDFAPDRSQRRSLLANADLTVRVAPPVASVARTALYNRYQAAQTHRKGWDTATKTTDEYAESFVQNPLPTGVEISAWHGDTLIAVALAETTPRTVSGVYHYHDPASEWRGRGLGTFILLQVIHLAARLGKPYAYFGYTVAGCDSLNYKTRFRPCEIQNDAGVWEAVSGVFAPPAEASGGHSTLR